MLRMKQLYKGVGDGLCPATLSNLHDEIHRMHAFENETSRKAAVQILIVEFTSSKRLSLRAVFNIIICTIT